MANSLQDRHHDICRGSAVACDLLCCQVKREACFAIFVDILSLLVEHVLTACSLVTWFEIGNSKLY